MNTLIKLTKKAFTAICIGLLLVVLTAGLAACGGDDNGNGNGADVEAGTGGADAGTGSDTGTGTGVQTQQTTTPPADTGGTGQTDWTLAELGATIEAAGIFWNSWWASYDTFDWSLIDTSGSNWQPFDPDVLPEHHPLSRGFAEILPASGFASLADISNYLLQFYTLDWVNRGHIAEPEVFFEYDAGLHLIFGFNGFEEYDDGIFVFIQGEWSMRPDWRNATHALVSLEGNRAVVESTVPTYLSDFDGWMPTIVYRFVMLDGRIDTAYGIFFSTQDEYGETIFWAQGYYYLLNDMLLFIYRAQDVAVESFDQVHVVGHPPLDGFTAGEGDALVIGATSFIRNVVLVILENDWDAGNEQITFSPYRFYPIADEVVPGEGISIRGYVGLGILPWSGIAFYDMQGERHFFAIQQDVSDSPYWYVLLNITRQMGSRV